MKNMVGKRQSCDCLGTKHTLINNCIKCGRIVCLQEGSGPCFFCSTFVSKNEEITSKGFELKKYNILSNNIAKVKMADPQLRKAEEHKDKLLEFDNSFEKRTMVIDDENDYFNTDSNCWLSYKEKNAIAVYEDSIRKLRFDSRASKDIALNLIDKSVKKSNDCNIIMPDTMKNLLTRKNSALIEKNTHNSPENIEAYISKPKYVPLTQKNMRIRVVLSNNNISRRVINQDKELQLMEDSGMCLSIRQPWASYLISGIKMHEGRSWYSSHRGHLWIHASSKVPHYQDIEALQKFYRNFYKESSIVFPTEFPTGCILGFVNIVDVFSQKEYCEQFTKMESTSHFVYVADNPQELEKKVKMIGKSKIYKLNSKIHRTLKNLLRQGPINYPIRK